MVKFPEGICRFSTEKVAKFDDKDLKQLISDRGIVRNRPKIVATTHNAKEFAKIKKEWGSFQSFLNSLDKSRNYASVIKELGKRFRRLGPSSTRIFLYSVGEDIKHSEE